MASVLDIKIAEAFLILFLAYNVMKQVQLRRYGFYVLRYGVHIS